MSQVTERERERERGRERDARDASTLMLPLLSGTDTSTVLKERFMYKYILHVYRRRKQVSGSASC